MSDDRIARNRFFALGLVRIIGVASVLVGILITQNVIAASAAIGYVLVIVGLLGVFVVPQMLARQWRTPDR